MDREPGENIFVTHTHNANDTTYYRVGEFPGILAQMGSARSPKFHGLLDAMKAIHDKKNRDYASDGNPYSNFEFAASLVKLFSDPIDQVFMTLLAVKMARLGELLGKGKDPQNEGAADSLLDLAVYAALWASYRGVGAYAETLLKGKKEQEEPT